ncbi:MAG TPA: hypothetical protein VFC84_04745 [Desulfosporosinus sp.]|nr:hypothetical protein [Desulfosporosinus sp.]
MQKKVFFVDICNTLANVNEQLNLIGFQTDVYPAPIPAEVLTEELFRQAKPIQTVVNLVKRLVDRGYSLVYLTARSESVREVTLEWLRANALPAGPVIHTNGRLKGEIALELVHVDWIAGAVEDSPYEIMGYIRSIPGIRLLVPEWPHNEGITKGIRIPLLRKAVAC